MEQIEPTRIEGPPIASEQPLSTIGPPEIPGWNGHSQTTATIATLAPEDLSSDDVLVHASHVTVGGRSMPALGGIPIYRKLGQGGMAAVYYGIHPRLNQEVAIKVLPSQLAQRQPQLAQRFLREAQIAARVRSPYLVSVTDVNAENGVLYLIMEFVSGNTAAAHARDVHGKTQHGLPEAIALDICIAATEGLASAHTSGIVHRDVKPDNIMVPAGPNFRAAKLADLGLAQLVEMGSDLTTDQSCMGTPGYIAPEQAVDARTAGKPADVFSMGATLFALLAGHAPFHGETPLNTILATIQKPHSPIQAYRPDVTAQTTRIIDTCLEKDPEKRFRDGAALLAELRSCRARLDQAGTNGVAPDFGARQEPAVAPTGLLNQATSVPNIPATTIMASPALRNGAHSATSDASVGVSSRPGLAGEQGKLEPTEPKRSAAATDADAISQLNKRQECLDEILKTINGSGTGDLPAMAQFVSEVCSALHSDQASGKMITDAILKDVALTKSLLQTVNSAFYTTGSSREIGTISYAVLVLGVDTISQVATCLNILDNTGGKSKNTNSLKKMIVGTLMTGAYARELARSGVTVQPEAAFIAGVMHNMSAVLISQHLPEKHKKIEQLIESEHCSREEASRRILGVSYSDISRAIAKSWKLNKVADSICEFDTNQPVLRNNRAQKFSAIVSMATGLAEATAIFDPAERAAAIARVSSQYTAFVPVNTKRFEQLLIHAEKAMGQITSALNVTRSDLITAPLPASADIQPAPPGYKPDAGATQKPALQGLGQPKRNMKQFFTAMDKTLSGKFELAEVLKSIMEVMQQECELDHVVLLLLTQQKDQLVARLGLGPRLDEYLRSFTIPIQNATGIMAQVITGPREVSSDSSDAARIAKELPEFAKGSTAILLPVVPKGKPIGCLFCQRTVLKGSFTANEKENLRQLRNRVTSAL